MKAADDITPLIEKLKKTAAGKPDSHTWDNQKKIAKQVQAKGAAAIPLLFPLLKDRNKEVRETAALALGGIDGLTENDLDPLIEAYGEGNHRVCTAIGRIGTQKAADFLTGEMNNLGEYDYGLYEQFAESIQLTGEKALPALLNLCENEDDWSSNLDSLMEFVFEDLGPKAAGAVDPLMKIATDKSIPWSRRQRTIRIVGHIGITAAGAVPALKEIYESKPDKDSGDQLQGAALYAIRDIGSQEGVAFFLQLLEKDEKTFYIEAIAGAQERGKSAGPALMKYLTGDKWDLRLNAARAMGRIGYRDSIDELIKLLGREDDWRTVWSAAISLGELDAEKALPDLQKISTQHWFLPVRLAAIRSIQIIHKEKKLTMAGDEDDYLWNFYGYQLAGDDMEELKLYDGKDESKSIKLPVIKTKQSFTVKGITAYGVVEQKRTGVKVDGGCIVGCFEPPACIGPWYGGDVSFFDEHGKNQKVIAHENTEDVFKMGDSIVAVTSVESQAVSWNSSCLFKISKDADGKWVASPWRQLPGLVSYTALLKDGSLFVNCLSGGMALISPDGKMKSLARKEVLGK